jgi:hypothetical protein
MSLQRIYIRSASHQICLRAHTNTNTHKHASTHCNHLGWPKSKMSTRGFVRVPTLLSLTHVACDTLTFFDNHVHHYIIPNINWARHTPMQAIILHLSFAVLVRSREHPIRAHMTIWSHY